MLPSGEGFGVELYELWVCGAVELPAIAERTALANQNLASSAAIDRSVFARHSAGALYAPRPTDTATGQVFPHWDALRDEMQRILAESVENVYESADALLRIAENYAAADDAAKQEMDRRKAALLDGSAGQGIAVGPERQPVTRPE